MQEEVVEWNACTGYGQQVSTVASCNNTARAKTAAHLKQVFVSDTLIVRLMLLFFGQSDNVHVDDTELRL